MLSPRESIYQGNEATQHRESYDKYKDDEKKYYDDVSDEFVWVSSAIHRGLRDLQFGVEGMEGIWKEYNGMEGGRNTMKQVPSSLRRSSNGAV